MIWQINVWVQYNQNFVDKINNIYQNKYDEVEQLKAVGLMSYIKWVIWPYIKN